MRKYKLILIFVLFFSFVIIGAGCKEEKVDWPEFCQGKAELPKELDKSLIFPGSKCVKNSDIYAYANALDLSFCAKAQKQEVLQWYKQELSNRGYEYWYDEEYAKDEYLWKKGQAYIILGLPYTQEGEFLYFTLTVHP